MHTSEETAKKQTEISFGTRDKSIQQSELFAEKGKGQSQILSRERQKLLLANAEN